MGLFTALLATAMIGIGAGVGVSKAVSGGGKRDGGVAPSPQPLPQAPIVEAASEKAEALKRKKVSAVTKSIYTSPLGVAGEADVARKTLLGQ